eukprot:13893761-Alexandrium_andersonii.AAC.1
MEEEDKELVGKFNGLPRRAEWRVADRWIVGWRIADWGIMDWRIADWRSAERGLWTNRLRRAEQLLFNRLISG